MHNGQAGAELETSSEGTMLMQPLTVEPINRDLLLDAIDSAVTNLAKTRISSDMVGIVAGGLRFLITGEDGTRLYDSDIEVMAGHEAALAAMFFCDLQDGWQGFPCEEDRRDAWTVCNRIAAAFCKARG